MELTEVLKRLAEDRHVPTCVFESWAHNMDPAELGRLIKEYVAESNHAGWDGFSRQYMTGIRAFLTDMIRYHVATTEHDPDNFKKLSNLNPK